jgi:hypothetical protein
MESGVIHYYRNPLGDCFKQPVLKPVIEKPAVGSVFVAFKGIIIFIANSGDYVGAPKFAAAFNIIDLPSAYSPPIFAL